MRYNERMRKRPEYRKHQPMAQERRKARRAIAKGEYEMRIHMKMMSGARTVYIHYSDGTEQPIPVDYAHLRPFDRL